ncbi:MAG: phage head spike fiber domain-containing protein, partial [Candidatus Kariarchaeaceae archaeon]
RNRADGGNTGIEFTRTQDTPSSYVKSDGIIGYAATDVPRFDHDPVTGESLGLLIEEGRTNFAPESEDWGDTTYWHSNGNKGGLNQASNKDYFITTNNTTDVSSPDGANNAVKLAGDTNYTSSGYGQGRVNIVTKSITLTQNTVYTFSVFVKDPNSVFDSNQIFYIMYGSIFSNTNAFAGFDLQNDTVSFGGNISNQSGSIKSYSNGWKKLTSTFTNTSSGGPPWIFIQETGNFNGPNTFSTNGESFYAFGFQIEQASFGTSYIPTSGSTSTRGADTASITGAGFSSFYNQSEGSILLDYRFTVNTTYPVFLRFNNSSSEGQLLYMDDRRWRWTDYNSGTSRDTSNATNYAYYQSYSKKLGLSYKNGEYPSFIYDGPESFYDASVTQNTTTPTKLSILQGSQGHISRLTYWPTALPDSDLQRLTE